MPNVLASLVMMWASSALRSSDLDGMKPIEAHSAPVLGFDDCGVQPQLGGTNGRDISAGAGLRRTTS